MGYVGDWEGWGVRESLARQKPTLYAGNSAPSLPARKYPLREAIPLASGPSWGRWLDGLQGAYRRPCACRMNISPLGETYEGNCILRQGQA